jgi:hypothetical protein
VSQALFIQARELIREERYDEARAILRGIDHPKAQQWLAKLDEIAPPPAVSSPRDQLVAARDLINAGRHDEARAILRTVDHPKAQQWLAKLDEIAPPPAAPSPQDQLVAARELIKAGRYDEARAILRTVDHPTAQQWLAKLDEIAPVPPQATRPESDSPHDTAVREAQRLLLKGEYDRARTILEPLDTPVAAFWNDKTAVNQFRSHENLWLDMFRYTIQSETPIDPAAWQCPTCGRRLDQTPMCPQRGQPPCPMQLSARQIEEPRRLALILEALQHNQAQNVEKLAGSTEAGRLERWHDALVWQLAHLQEPDVRRPAIAAALTLLGQLAAKRRTGDQ